MLRLRMPLLLLALLALAGCPGDDFDAQNTGSAASGNGEAEQSDEMLVPEASPLEGIEWDGNTASMQLADFCEMLISEGAAALLEKADFSDFDYRMETETSGAEPVSIAIWIKPEEETPVGFEAQLVAFDEGQRLIFGFSAAWYEANFGLGLEELDEQFRSMHEEHDGVLKNYAWLDPDLDISFFQFDFDNDAEGTWGSPYMMHKRFTMHGDVPEWNFYCIGVDAGATLATRNEFRAEAEAGDIPREEPPAGLDESLEPDALLLAAMQHWPALQQRLDLSNGAVERREGFSLQRILLPVTVLEYYTLHDADGQAMAGIRVAERSQVQEFSFIDSWLGSQEIDRAAFLQRFEELRESYGGWEGEEHEAADTWMKDSGVIIGNWELARRSFSIGESATTSSWVIRRLKGWEEDSAESAETSQD